MSSVTNADILPVGTKIVVLGDSHTQCSINDELCPMFVNRSSVGEPFFYSYHKLKNIIESNNNNKDSIGAVVLGFHAFSLEKFRDNENNNKYYLKAFRNIHQKWSNHPRQFNLPVKDDYYQDYIIANLNMLDNEDLSKLARGKNNLYSGYKGGYLFSNDCVNYDDILKRNEELGSFHILEDEFSLKYNGSKQPIVLDSIARLAYKNSIPLVLVDAPCHKLYSKQIYNQIQYYNDSIAQHLNRKYGVIYLNFRDLPLDDDCYRDLTHLNTKGANIFTPMLRDTLISLGLY